MWWTIGALIGTWVGLFMVGAVATGESKAAAGFATFMVFLIVLAVFVAFCITKAVQ